MDQLGAKGTPLTVESRWSSAVARVARSSFWPRLLYALVGPALSVASYSCDPQSDNLHTSVALVNVTHQAVALQVFRPTTELTCAAVEDDPQATLGSNDFALDSCRSIVPFSPAPLDLDATEVSDYEDPAPSSSPHRTCDAVLLRAAGLDDTVLFWNDLPQQSINLYDDVPLDSANIAYLNKVGQHLFILPPSAATGWVATFEQPAADCSSAP